jgi:formylglycine-generating enzyme required for sulfatase activity
VAAREAYPKLALKYLCFRNEDFCDASIGPKPGRQCPVGQVATEETQNQCCWPGQGHNGKKCVGKVSACPDGFALSEDETECTLLACKPGQKRVSDIYCCWPEQGYAEGACVGAPSCPSGYFAHELECLPGNGKDEVAMSFVAAGKFSMGSKKAESKTAHELCKETGNNAAACDESWYDVEQPAHEVSLSAYFLDSYEVSNAQYQRCVDAGKCSAIDEAQCFVLTSAGWQQGKSLASEQLKSDRPVVCVSWVQAKDYCAFAGKRLPTEAEWEYAARGPSGWRYPWGDAWKSTLANWGEKGGWGGVDGYRTSAPVGSFPGGISPFGVHDLSGNVWEWVGDGWSDYEKGAQTDPTGVEGENRVMRGGGFGDAADSLRSTFRAAGPQSYAAAFLGFRCAASAEPK